MTGITSGGSKTQSMVRIEDKRVLIGSCAVLQFRDLTRSQQRFCIFVASGADPNTAYRLAYPNSTKLKAYQLVKDHRIMSVITELSAYRDRQLDFGKRKMAERLMNLFSMVAKGDPEDGGRLYNSDKRLMLDIYREINKMFGNYELVPDQTSGHRQTIEIKIVPSRQIDVDNIQEADVIDDKQDENYKEPPSLDNLNKFLSR